MKKKIIVIDYGCGNIESIKRGFDSIEENCIISNDASEIKSASHLILPGVGSFKNAINKLSLQNMTNLILDHYNNKKPLLGICLGMQLLFSKSYEFGETKGLDIFKGEVIKLKSNDKKNYKIPNIGWYKLNESNKQKNKKELACLNNGKYYHIHSYYCKPENEENITHNIDYDNNKICISYKEGNVIGVQFHPEKSRKHGLDLLKFFSNI